MARPPLDLFEQLDCIRIVHAVHSPERLSRPRQRSPPRHESPRPGPKYSPLLVQSSSQPEDPLSKKDRPISRLRQRPLQVHCEHRREFHAIPVLPPSERIHGLPSFSRRTARGPSRTPMRPVSLTLYSRPQSRLRPASLLKQGVTCRPPQVTVICSNSRKRSTKLILNLNSQL